MLPSWMRTALWATALLNLLGTITFLPGGHLIRQRMSLPPETHPMYLWIIAEFIFIFGVAYAYCAWTNRAPRVFIGVAAAGKFAFFTTLAGFWLSGDLPVKSVLAGSADLFFSGLFLAWLLLTRNRPN